MRWTFFVRSSLLLAIARGHLQGQIVISAGTAAARRIGADWLAGRWCLDQLDVERNHGLENKSAILLTRCILDHLVHTGSAIDHRHDDAADGQRWVELPHDRDRLLKLG